MYHLNLLPTHLLLFEGPKGPKGDKGDQGWKALRRVVASRNGNGHAIACVRADCPAHTEMMSGGFLQTPANVNLYSKVFASFPAVTPRGSSTSGWIVCVKDFEGPFAAYAECGEFRGELEVVNP